MFIVNYMENVTNLWNGSNMYYKYEENAVYDSALYFFLFRSDTERQIKHTQKHKTTHRPNNQGLLRPSNGLLSTQKRYRVGMSEQVGAVSECV